MTVGSCCVGLLGRVLETTFAVLIQSQVPKKVDPGESGTAREGPGIGGGGGLDVTGREGGDLSLWDTFAPLGLGGCDLAPPPPNRVRPWTIPTHCTGKFHGARYSSDDKKMDLLYLERCRKISNFADKGDLSFQICKD